MTDPNREDPLLFVFFNEIGIINQLSQHRLEQTFPPGFKISHFSVLNHFVRLDRESSPSRLARNFQVTKGAMTNTLGWLSRAGYVEIRTDPNDGRAKIVSITESGRQMRDQAVAGIAPILRAFSQQFPEEELAQVLPLLQAIREYLDRDRD